MNRRIIKSLIIVTVLVLATFFIQSENPVFAETLICEGDFDRDGDVDGSDLAIFAADFGRVDCYTFYPGSLNDCEGDFDNDGDVDGSDLAIFSADFGRVDCEICNNDGICDQWENEENCPEDCYLDGYLSIATLKDVYKIDEKIELTDPPEAEKFTVVTSKVKPSHFLGGGNEMILNENEMNYFSIPKDSNVDDLIINKFFNSSSEILIDYSNKISSVSVSAKGQLFKEDGYVRVLLKDVDDNEFLIFGSDSLIVDNEFDLENICEETCNLKDNKIKSLIIEIKDANINLDTVNFQKETSLTKTKLFSQNFYDLNQHDIKIKRWKEIINKKGLKWIPGETSVSGLSYTEKKKLFSNDNGIPVDELPNLQGFEYYKGGVFQIGAIDAQTETTNVGIPVSWDWRDAHGENWMTSIKNQGNAGNCWAFARIGALEPQINLYYNQHLNVDLSEQMMVDCQIEGSIEELKQILGKECEFCSGQQYCRLTYAGIADEDCDPYASRGITNACDYDHICVDWDERVWKISDFRDYKFNSSGSLYCVDETVFFLEDELKKFLVEKGPQYAVVRSWGHAMVLVGYNGYDNWKTLDYCDRYNKYCSDKGCINKGEPCEEIGSTICTGPNVYVCNSSNQWEEDYSSFCFTSCINNKCVSQEELDNLTEGDIKCQSFFRKRYDPNEGDSYWIFKNSWGENWGEEGYARIAMSLKNMGYTSVPFGPFTLPLNTAYWPRSYVDQINCVDKDRDNYCNWGITETKPETCPSSCNTEKDYDDSDPLVGPFYRPQSKIVNSGTLVIEGYLYMEIQKKIGKSWKTYFVAVNESHKLNPIDLTKLDHIWNPKSITINKAGIYRVHASVRNDKGEVINIKSGKLENSWEFQVAKKFYDPTLVSPPNISATPVVAKSANQNEQTQQLQEQVKVLRLQLIQLLPQLVEALQKQLSSLL